MRTVIAVVLLIGIWPMYVWLAWHIRRAAGRRAFVLLWIGVSAMYGYLRYRFLCTQSLTCCVGGTSPYFLTGNPYYFIHYVPVFAAIGSVAFGVASVIVDRVQGREARVSLFGRALLSGALATFAAFMAASIIADVLSIHPV